MISLALGRYSSFGCLANLISSKNTARLLFSTQAAVNDHEESSIFWCHRVVFPEGVQEGFVEVQHGTILSCQRGKSLADAKNYAQSKQATFLDLGNFCLSPGLIDVHVHISALGRDWEGYESATRAAAAGGITTIVGMPLNSLPPTIDLEAVARELAVAHDSPLFVDVGLWGGVVPKNCNENDLNEFLDSPAVLGLKAFLSPLPPAAGYEAISPEQLLKAARICGRHSKPILVHAELMSEKEWLETTETAYQQASPSSYQSHVQSRPAKWEQDAVKVVCEAASYCHMHVVHLSDAGCLEVIRKTKENPDKQLTVETCSHYLLLDSKRIEDGDTRVKCFPPLRDGENRERLWKEGMETGLIDMVTSDHSPCEPFMRHRETGNLQQAWGGLTGLQYQLPATWTEAVKRNYSWQDMSRWWAMNPAALAGMEKQKGSIEEGKRADFCWWDPEYKGAPNDYSVEYHRWKGDTYYANNQNMRGRVLGTWVKGVKVYDGERDEHLDAVGSFVTSSA